MPHRPVCVPAPGMHVFLIDRDGLRREFSSLQSLSHWLAGRVSKSRAARRAWDLAIGRHFVERCGANWLGEPHYRHFDYILRDGRGGVVAVDSIPAPTWAQAWRSRRELPQARFRQDPVPRTGRSGGRHWNTLRYPRTQAARRLAFGPLEEHEPAIRWRRSACALPTAWDDQARTRQRSWKEHRRTQWKPTHGQ